jgi:hypothetical protein
MSDIFDYIVLYLFSLLLAVLKFTLVITWPWWVVALPTVIGLSLWIIVAVASRS